MHNKLTVFHRFQMCLARLRGGSRNPEAGIGKLTVMVFGTLIAVTIYCTYEILPFYYYYYELKNQMEAGIHVASTDTDKEIRDKLKYHIRKMDLPVGDDDMLQESLKIERDDNLMRISLPYVEVFSLRWGEKEYVLHRFKFHAYAEGNIK